MYSFPQMLEIAGYSDLVQLTQQGNAQYWSAAYNGPTRKFEEYFLYLPGESGWGDVEEIGKWLRLGSGSRDITVVVRNSARRLRENLPRISSILQCSRVYTVSQFLFSTFERAIGRWKEVSTDAQDFGLEYFVEPTVRFPSAETSGSSVSRLMKWLRGEGASESNVAVLLAPAGTGKSTLALELFRRITQMQRADIIPLLVTREQWIAMAYQDSLSLTDVWKAAVNAQFPNAIIGPEQLEVCLSGGTICPIFDGLDELFTLFASHFNPTDTVNDLLTLFREGRLLITSRSRFWSENISPATRSEILEFDLRPFTMEQRDQYIAKRFPKSASKQQKLSSSLIAWAES